jgi:hypothetical protein
MAILANNAPFTTKLDHNIGFQEKRQYFPENWRKSSLN